jgi:glycosyltransferase involved in cell wall biosynthesis
MIAACPFPLPRGTPVRIFKMAEALAARGHEVHLVTYHLGDHSKKIPFPVHRIPDIRTYKKLSPGPDYQKLFVLDPLLALKTKNVVRDNSFDLIHAHHFEGFLASIAAAKMAKIPLVFDMHTLLESELPYYDMKLPTGLKKWVGRFLDFHLPGCASHIIAVTDTMKIRLVERGIALPDSVSVISSGVEWEHFHSKDKAEKKDGKIIIFSGNLSDYQNIEFLIKAFRLVLKKRKDARLTIVSHEPEKKNILLAKKLGVAEYLDFVISSFEDLPRYLSSADVAVIPRMEYEGIPQKLLNYMAAGVPVVTFADHGNHLKDGAFGQVVKERTLLAFSEAILCLLANPDKAAAMGRKARHHAEKELSWQRVAVAVERVYEKQLK